MMHISGLDTDTTLSALIGAARRLLAEGGLPRHGWNECKVKYTNTVTTDIYCVLIKLFTDGTITETVDLLAGCRANTATTD